MTETSQATLQPLVLIVDDEPQIRRFLRTGFEMQSFRVIEAETARQAIELAVMRAPELIVLDLGLPDADGSSVLDTLRTWSQSAIIVLSVRNAEAEKIALLSDLQQLERLARTAMVHVRRHGPAGRGLYAEGQ